MARGRARRPPRVGGPVLTQHEHTDDLPDRHDASGGALRRAERRRGQRDVIEEGAPREGVDIIRPVERAVIVGVQLRDRRSSQVEASLDELEALLDTAGAQVVHREIQRRDSPDPATYIGKGKVGDLKDVVAQLGADAVVFDDELTPAQQRNLEESVRQKVLDRTIVILDIFAQHARSREGKTQVELAQLGYLLPRLRGWGEALSRQAGGRAAGGVGIGGRGPGETQLEVDRRRIQRRMKKLRQDLDAFERIRRTKSQERARNQVPTAALVGYTNAGKSSLLNRLTGASVSVRNQLFETLDTTVRRLELAGSREVVVSDTVGFVEKLPHGLVEAFKSTLEETTRADLLLHVVDVSHPEAQAHVSAVRDVLAEIGADEVPELVVLNKIDLADRATITGTVRELRGSGGDPVCVSAATGTGLGELIERIALRLPGQRLRISATIPYRRQDLVAMAHRAGEVHKERHTATGTELVATVDEDVALAMREWLDDDPFERELEPWET